jgi:hypothetical protein
MTSNGKVKFEEVDGGRDGLARTFKLHLDGKTLLMPNYCTPLNSTFVFNDLDQRLRIQGQTMGHTGSYVVKGFNYDRILLPHVKEIDQSTITGEGFSNPVFREFYQTNLGIYDSSGESLEYSQYTHRLAGSKRTPREARRLAGELEKILPQGKGLQIRRKMVWDFWGDMDDDLKAQNKLQGDVMDYGAQTEAGVVLPFMITIKNKGSYAISKRTNKLFKPICQANSKPTVDYKVLSKWVFNDDDLIDEICDEVESLETDFAFLKVKNSNFTEGEEDAQRKAYGRLLLAYANLRNQRHDKTVTGCLESGSQIFLNAAKSFDIVSRNMNGIDREGGGGGGASPPAYGSALDLDSLILMKFRQVQEAFNRIGRMPCPHDYCAKIATMDTHEYPMDEWNVDRRIHNMLIMDEWMHQISSAITSGEARLIPQKLFSSPLAVLGPLVPN